MLSYVLPSYVFSISVYSWKLGRSRAGLSTAANNVIDQLVSSNIDLHERYYRYTAQDDAACFYYPDFDQLPAVIELPGPCNTTIRAVSNFNAAAVSSIGVLLACISCIQFSLS